ncbi:MAG: hypothetical protein Q7V88_04055 [Actinomycetota bacterium]|nr:hypothetical protein [Actinomycetota bacterium]
MKPRRQLPDSTLSAWLLRIADTGAQPDRRLYDAATDLVETMGERPAGLHGALYRFGNELGSDGWPIGTIDGWLQLLSAGLDRPRRRQLARFGARTSLAEGWADGYVRGAHTGRWIDPITGLETLLVLRLRLREVYEQSLAAHVSAADLYSLIIVDLDTHGLPLLEADLLLAGVADTVRGVFQRGETIARAGDRIMVLAAHSADTESLTEILADRLRLGHSTRRARANVLADHLPEVQAYEADVIDRYLRDLVA